MSLLKSHLNAMSPYSPPLEGRGEGGHLLLDFNERTLPVGKDIEQALVDFIQSGKLQMYPSYGNVVERIANYAQVNPEQLMITNGSDQGIDLVFRAACSSGDEVIIPEPSFPMYSQVALVENCKVLSPVYDINGGYPLDEVLSLISEQTKVIVVSNPNNPSGTLLEIDGVETKQSFCGPALSILIELDVILRRFIRCQAERLKNCFARLQLCHLRMKRRHAFFANQTNSRRFGR